MSVRRLLFPSQLLGSALVLCVSCSAPPSADLTDSGAGADTLGVPADTAEGAGDDPYMDEHHAYVEGVPMGYYYAPARCLPTPAALEAIREHNVSPETAREAAIACFPDSRFSWAVFNLETDGFLSSKIAVLSDGSTVSPGAAIRLHVEEYHEIWGGADVEVAHDYENGDTSVESSFLYVGDGLAADEFLLEFPAAQPHEGFDDQIGIVTLTLRDAVERLAFFEGIQAIAYEHRPDAPDPNAESGSSAASHARSDRVFNSEREGCPD
jgi:hypothetical protein